MKISTRNKATNTGNSFAHLYTGKHTTSDLNLDLVKLSSVSPHISVIITPAATVGEPPETSTPKQRSNTGVAQNSELDFSINL